MYSMKQTVTKLGGASMMTEWGGTCVDPSQRAECVFVADLADAHLQSYTEWDGCFPNNLNLCSAEYISLFSRSFARTTAGVVVNMTYHDFSKAFEVCYTPTTSALPTEIYANFALHYSARTPHVTVPPGYTYKLLLDENVLLVYASAGPWTTQCVTMTA